MMESPAVALVLDERGKIQVERIISYAVARD
jgi:hypothetical protein